jgi:hypothetical protein
MPGRLIEETDESAGVPPWTRNASASDGHPPEASIPIAGPEGPSAFGAATAANAAFVPGRCVLFAFGEENLGPLGQHRYECSHMVVRGQGDHPCGAPIRWSGRLVGASGDAGPSRRSAGAAHRITASALPQLPNTSTVELPGVLVPHGRTLPRMSLRPAKPTRGGAYSVFVLCALGRLGQQNRSLRLGNPSQIQRRVGRIAREEDSVALLSLPSRYSRRAP